VFVLGTFQIVNNLLHAQAVLNAIHLLSIGCFTVT